LDRVVLAETAERVDQSSKTRPTQAAQSSVFEATDDRLIDTTKRFEMALREPEPQSSSTDEAADQLEAASGPSILALDAEQMPGHRTMVTAATYRAISRSRVGEGFSG
jgi:hypothetical protein